MLANIGTHGFSAKPPLRECAVDTYYKKRCKIRETYTDYALTLRPTGTEQIKYKTTNAPKGALVGIRKKLF